MSLTEQQIKAALAVAVDPNTGKDFVAGKAVKNIKIDKITVWDSGNGENGNGSTANFVSGMMKTVPPLNDLFNMAGLNLPTYLKGTENPEESEVKKVE